MNIVAKGRTKYTLLPFQGNTLSTKVVISSTSVAILTKSISHINFLSNELKNVLKMYLKGYMSVITSIYKLWDPIFRTRTDSESNLLMISDDFKHYLSNFENKNNQFKFQLKPKNAIVPIKLNQIRIEIAEKYIIRPHINYIFKRNAEINIISCVCGSCLCSTPC